MATQGGMMAPYLVSFFELWKGLVGCSAIRKTRAETSAIDLLSLVADHVPSRLLLPALLETLKAPTPPSIAEPLVATLAVLVRKMDHNSVQECHFDVVNFILGALDG